MSSPQIRITLREYMLSLLLAYVTAADTIGAYETTTQLPYGGYRRRTLQRVLQASGMNSGNAFATAGRAGQVNIDNDDYSDDELNNYDDELKNHPRAKKQVHEELVRLLYNTDFIDMIVQFAKENPTAFITFLPIAGVILNTCRNEADYTRGFYEKFAELGYLEQDVNNANNFTITPKLDTITDFYDKYIIGNNRLSTTYNHAGHINLNPSGMYCIADALAAEYHRAAHNGKFDNLASFLNGAKEDVSLFHGIADKFNADNLPVGTYVPDTVAPAQAGGGKGSEWAETKEGGRKAPKRRVKSSAAAANSDSISDFRQAASRPIRLEGSHTGLDRPNTDAESEKKAEEEDAQFDAISSHSSRSSQHSFSAPAGSVRILRSGHERFSVPGLGEVRPGHYRVGPGGLRDHTGGAGGQYDDEDVDDDEYEDDYAANDVDRKKDPELDERPALADKLIDEIIQNYQAIDFIQDIEDVVVVVNGIKLISGNSTLMRYIAGKRSSSGADSGSFGKKQWAFSMDNTNNVTTIYLAEVDANGKVSNTKTDVRKFTLNSRDNATCKALGLQEVGKGCGSLMNQCDGSDPTKCLEKLSLAFDNHPSIDVGLAAIAKVNPVTAKKFLMKLKWGRINYEKSKQSMEYRFIVDWEKAKEDLESKGVTIGPQFNKRAQTFLSNLAKYLNEVYPEAANPMHVVRADGSQDPTKTKYHTKQANEGLRYGIRLSAGVKLVPLPGLGLGPSVKARTESMVATARRISNPLPFFGFGGPIVAGRQYGGERDKYGIEISGDSDASSEESLPGLKKMQDFYDGTLKNFTNKFKTLKKELHPQVKSKMDDRLNAFKEAAKDFSKRYNTLRKYTKLNMYGPEDTQIKPTFKQMDEFNRSFEKSAAKYAISEVNVLKLIGTLSNGLQKVAIEVGANRDRTIL